MTAAEPNMRAVSATELHSRRSIALAGIAIALGIACALALLPFVYRSGPELPGFSALFAGVMLAMELATSLLLVALFRQVPRYSLLFLLAAYLYSAVMAVAYLLTFPGALAPTAPLLGGGSSVAWVFNLWLVGFSLLTILAVASEAWQPPLLQAAGGGWILTFAIAVPIAAAAAILATAVFSADALPPLIRAGQWTLLNIALSSAAIALLVASTVLTLVVLRPVRELFLWLSLAMAAMAIGSILTLLGGGRFTVGWYAARFSWLLSSAVVLLYFVLQFLRQHRALSRAAEDVAERTRERDRVWNVSDDLLGVSTVEGYFTSINPTWEKVLGWTEDEVRQMSVEVLRHPDDGPHSRAARAQLAQGGPTVRLINRLRHKDGTWRWISWAMTADQGLIYVAGRDITVERQAEEALRKAEADAAHLQKMEALGQLTGGVAHDFNNLLMIVGGYLPRLKSSPPNDAKHEQAVAAIQLAVDRGASLTRQLLAFSRRQPLNPELVDVRQRLSALQPVLQSSLEARITLSVKADPDLGLVRVDAGELELALLNLVLNARDAIDGQGRLSITCWNATQRLDKDVESSADFPCIEIAITDTGRGMEKAVLDHAFEPFFTTKAMGKGSGLGLAQVHAFAQRSGGTVRIESNPGNGTTITLALPRTSGTPTETSPKSLPVAVHSGNALLVEDNVNVAEVTRAMLEELGYVVSTAHDAAGGLNLARTEDFDLVVSDIVMPSGMTGIDMADVLSKEQPTLPVLLVSGYAKTVSSTPAHLVVLRKPFTVERLAAAIERVRAVPARH